MGFPLICRMLTGVMLAFLTVTTLPAAHEEDDCPRTQGFWKRVCEKSHPSGEHDLIPGYVPFVKGTETFSSVNSRKDICAQLNPKPKNDKRAQAKAQYMAVLLNVASSRLLLTDELIDSTPGVKTVGDFVDWADCILTSENSSRADYVQVQALADDINNCLIVPGDPGPIGS